MEGALRVLRAHRNTVMRTLRWKGLTKGARARNLIIIQRLTREIEASK